MFLLARSGKFVLSSPSVFPSLLTLRLRGWRPLINFSRWLALFVRRYGIFSLCVSRIARRFSILPILPSPSSSPSPFSLFLSPFVGLPAGATDWSPPPSFTKYFPLCTRVCVGSGLGGTNGENTRENAKDEEKGDGGLFLFQERSFEYEYALIDS